MTYITINNKSIVGIRQERSQTEKNFTASPPPVLKMTFTDQISITLKENDPYL